MMTITNNRPYCPNRRAVVLAVLAVVLMPFVASDSCVFGSNASYASSLTSLEPVDSNEQDSSRSSFSALLPTGGIMPIICLTLGFLGQFLFGIRFLVQWIASERSKTIVIPRAFWWISIVGAITTAIYSISILAYPIIMSQGLNCFIYTRSLYISYNKDEPKPTNTEQENQHRPAA